MTRILEFLAYCWWRLWNKLPEPRHDPMHVAFEVYDERDASCDVLATHAPPLFALVEALSISHTAPGVWEIGVKFVAIEEARRRGLHHSEADHLARVIADVMARNESMALIPNLVEQYQSAKMREEAH